MPVRIYDIAKKLGIESKEVLAKAKELGITGAKVPSSSLDKITAQYLEEKLGGGKPVTVLETPPTPEPVVIFSAPPEPAHPPIETPLALPGTEPTPEAVAPPASGIPTAPEVVEVQGAPAAL